MAPHCCSGGSCSSGASSGARRGGGRPFALVWSPIPLITWLMPFIGHMGVCSSTGRTYDFAGPCTVNEDRLLFGYPTRYLVLVPGGASGSDGNDDDDEEAGSGRDPEAQPLKGTPAANDACGSGGGGCCDGGPCKAGGAGPGCCEGVGGAGGGGGACCAKQGGGGARGGKAAAGEAAVRISAQSWDHRLTLAANLYRLFNYSLLTSNCHCFVAHFLNQLGYKGGGWDMVNLAVLMFLRGRYTYPSAFVMTWLPWAVVMTAGAVFGGPLFWLCYAGLCVPLLGWLLAYTWCCWRDLSP
ncbi:hypothetical protein HYH03_010149 [Edaphochlamys debaryana]|uniref:Uncharacterized protein n=1 Tax=Edaphochlamys debaryana TaxID=47281 RepID=A0A835XUV4_9CHLO|nr:hypothetical protein HYH03_010149 [Edaphochlamys debaryana]|eukprot:KAG2491582.1 hypothetical protein HYH03_010149 [Edaphochlamys debaryana]